MIIAVDFDGVLVKDEFPNIGEPDLELMGVLMDLQAYYDMDIIVWTCRLGKELEAMRAFLSSYGWTPTAINASAPSNRDKYMPIYGEEPRKIYADLYIDDHSIGYSRFDVLRKLKDLRSGEEKMHEYRD